MAVFFGLLSALGYGAGNCLVHLGVRDKRITTSQAMLINLLTASAALLLLFGVSVAVGGMPLLNWRGIVFFAASGLMGPLLGRASNFAAIRRIGATRTATLGCTECLFAVPIAYTLTGQRVSLLTACGIVVIMVAVALFINLTRGGLKETAGERDCLPEDGERAVLVETAVAASPSAERAAAPRPGLTYQGLGVAIALVAGLFFAVGNTFRQIGVAAIPSAYLGSVIGTLVALGVTGIDLWRRGETAGVWSVSGRQSLPIIAAALAQSMDMLCFFLALKAHGAVAVVTALKNTSPIITFFIASLFLGRSERVSWRAGLLVAMAALGAVLVNLG